MKRNERKMKSLRDVLGLNFKEIIENSERKLMPVEEETIKAAISRGEVDGFVDDEGNAFSTPEAVKQYASDQPAE